MGQSDSNDQATAELDDELIISMRCGGGGKHRKHAGQWVPRTRVEKHWTTHFNTHWLQLLSHDATLRETKKVLKK